VTKTLCSLTLFISISIQYNVIYAQVTHLKIHWGEGNRGGGQE
jgi:hypothetical protein